MKKTLYTSKETISKDALFWRNIIEYYMRHTCPVTLSSPALVVIDMQRWFLDKDSQAFLPSSLAIVSNIDRLIKVFKKHGFPVVLTVHLDKHDKSGQQMLKWWGKHITSGWENLFDPEWIKQSDKVITKHTYSAFYDTELEGFLKARGVEDIVITGVQTHICIDTTAREAFCKGFSPVIVADATASSDLTLHIDALETLSHCCAKVCLTHELLSLLGDGNSFNADEKIKDVGEQHLDVVVVGGGPAGISAGIQSHRQGLRTILVEKKAMGGLLVNADWVENYPGFVGGISGAKLAKLMHAHLEATGVRVFFAEVESIQATPEGLCTTLSNGGRLISKVIILATGTIPRYAQIPGETSCNRLFYSVIDALRSGGKSWCVIGGGDCAFDNAIALAKNHCEVTVLVRGEKPKALQLLVERAKTLNVDIKLMTEAIEIRDVGEKTCLLIREDRRINEILVNGVLVAVGRLPAFPNILFNGWNKNVDMVGRTCVPGLYIAGDCRRGNIRQTSVAVGDGVSCAMDACRFILEGLWR